MSNNAVVGVLRALLTLDKAEFVSGLKKSQDELKAFSRETKTIGQQAAQLGASLTKTITLPLLAFGGAAAKAAMDFESSFAGVRKTLNATEEEFAALADGIRGMAKSIPVSVNELNRLAEAAGALGIPKEEILEFTRVMAQLGVTTNLTSDQAAESIAKIQNIFGAAGRDTEKFASTLVALGNDGASTESQILEMATRIAGAGNVIGMTQGQVLGFANALSSVGLEAEAGGTAISRVFIEIAAAVNEGGESVANFARVAGQPVAEFSRLFKEDAATAVSAFISGLGRIKTSGGDLLGTLEALGFSEIRVRDTLLRTAGAGDLLTQSLALQESAWRSNSALSEEAAKRFGTTSSQLGTLGNLIRDVGITIGNAFLPLITATVDAMKAWLPAIEAIAKSFAALSPTTQGIIVGLGLLVAGAGPAIYAFGQLALASSALAGAFTRTGLISRAFGLVMAGVGTTASATAALVSGAAVTMRTAVLGLLGPIGAAAAALLALHAASQKYHIASKLTDEQIRQEIETLKKVGGQMALSRAASLEAALAQRQQASATSETNDELKTLQTELAKATNQGLTPFNVATLKTAEGMKEADKAAAAWRQTMNDVGEALMQADRAQMDYFRNLGEGLKSMRANTPNALLGGFALGGPGALAALGVGPGALTGGDVPQYFVKGGVAIGMSLRAGLSQSLSGLGDVIRAALVGGGGMGGAVKALASDIGETLTTNLFGAGGALNGFANAATRGVSKIFGNMIGDAFGLMLPGIGSVIGPLIGKLGSAISGLFGVSQAEKEGRKAATDFRQGLLNGLNEQQKAAAGNDQWKGTVIAIRDAYLAVGRTEAEALAMADRLWRAEKQGAGAVKQVMDEIVEVQRQANQLREDALALVDAQAQKQRMLDEALARYNFTATEKGPAINQKEMAAQAEQLLNDYKLLTEAGIDQNAVLREMSGSMSDFVNRAVATGTAIPEAFRAILQQMVDSGQLLDENGDAFKTLEQTGVTFGDTLESMFTRVLEKLEELIAKLSSTSISIPVRFDIEEPPSPPTGPTKEIPYDGPVWPEDYHTGGLVTAHDGLFLGSRFAPGEVFAKLLTGEGVLSRMGMSNLGGPGVLDALNSGRLMDPLSGISSALSGLATPSSFAQTSFGSSTTVEQGGVIAAIGRMENRVAGVLTELPRMMHAASVLESA